VELIAYDRSEKTAGGWGVERSGDERDRKVTRGKVHLTAHHPHNAVSRIPILKVKDRSPDIKKNVIHMDKACAYRRRAVRMRWLHTRAASSSPRVHTHAVRTATAKTRGKPVSVPRETCMFFGITKSERMARNSVTNIGHKERLCRPNKRTDISRNLERNKDVIITKFVYYMKAGCNF